MTLGSFFLGMMVATLMGAGYHLWSGGRLLSLLADVVVAWVGFWLGHWAGGQWGILFGSVGALHLGAGILGGLLALALWFVISRIPTAG